MTKHIPIVCRSRLLKIIQGYVNERSDKHSRPDMNSELRLLELCEIVVSECEARLPLWKLEQENEK